jgi:hypothetical protein
VSGFISKLKVFLIFLLNNLAADFVGEEGCECFIAVVLLSFEKGSIGGKKVELLSLVVTSFLLY